MDPEANLKEQRELTAYLLASDADDDIIAEKGRRLAELVDALDGWIVQGGFLPRRWRDSHTKPLPEPPR